MDFCFISVPFGHYDEPEILPYAITRFCPTGADAGHTFWWPDGRRLEALHPGSYRDGKLWWDTDLIRGHAFQGDERTCILTWTRNDTPDAHLYELIAISEDNQTRARTWHWFRGGAVYQRTLVDERRVG